MRPVTETPTERSDYALLSATYGALLGATAMAARAREPIPAREIVPLSAATFALSKLIVHEKVETWLRAPFVEESPDGKRPKGGGLRYAVGELLSCTRCLGAWSALGLVSIRAFNPRAGRLVTTVLATSAGNDFLQSGFSWLCSRASMAEEDAELDATQRASADRVAA